MARIWKRLKGEEGFTLIELMIVVVVIGILAGIAVPMYRGVQEKARIAATQAELSGIRTALILYELENNGELTTVGALEDYLDSDLDVADSNATVGTYLKKYQLTIKDGTIVVATTHKDRYGGSVTKDEVTVTVK